VVVPPLLCGGTTPDILEKWMAKKTEKNQFLIS